MARATCGVDDDDVVLGPARVLDTGARDGHRVAVAAGALTRLGDDVVAEDVAALRRRPARQRARRRPRGTGDGVRALEVGGHEQGV